MTDKWKKEPPEAEGSPDTWPELVWRLLHSQPPYRSHVAAFGLGIIVTVAVALWMALFITGHL